MKLAQLLTAVVKYALVYGNSEVEIVDDFGTVFPLDHIEVFRGDKRGYRIELHPAEGATNHYVDGQRVIAPPGGYRIG